MGALEVVPDDRHKVTDSGLVRQGRAWERIHAAVSNMGPEALERIAADLEGTAAKEHDAVNHPAHYTSHPSGIECIQVARHFGFNLGNVIKYLWRAPLKGATLEDLKKARWYLDDEIRKAEGT